MSCTDDDRDEFDRALSDFRFVLIETMGQADALRYLKSLNRQLAEGMLGRLARQSRPEQR